MQDDNYRRAAAGADAGRTGADAESAGVDLPRYASPLIDRYCNPALKHRTADSHGRQPEVAAAHALDSCAGIWRTSKISQLLALGVAGWMRYVGGADDAGQAIEICDPLLPVIQQAVAASAEGEARVKALLGIEAIFGLALPQEPVSSRR